MPVRKTRRENEPSNGNAVPRSPSARIAGWPKDDLYESSLMRDHPASRLPPPHGRLPLRRSIYNRAEFTNASLNRGAKKFGHRLGQQPWKSSSSNGQRSRFQSPPLSLSLSLSLSFFLFFVRIGPPSSFVPRFKDESHGPEDLDRRRVLDGRPITATYSYRHPNLSVATHSIIIPSPGPSSTFRFPAIYTCAERRREGMSPGVARDREHLRRLLPLLNRARLHTARGPRNLAAAASFTSESEAWLEPIQPSGGDSSATGCGATRATRRRRSGSSTILRKIQCSTGSRGDGGLPASTQGFPRSGSSS